MLMLMNTPAKEEAGTMQSNAASMKSRAERNTFMGILQISSGAIWLPGE
jgi:hypothetical protein